MILLSIIIPVYNVEKYVAQTLDSVQNQQQGLFDYEVIVVDDGTPDNSMQVVNRYKDVLPIKIIHQENKGLSGARNTGLRHSEGKYVWFVDSDDSIAPDIFEVLARLLTDSNVDIYGFNVQSIVKGRESFIEYPCSNPKIRNYYYDKIINWRIIGKSMAPGMAPRYIFRRDFLNENKIGFKEGIIFEDTEFNVKTKCLAKTICFKDIISYHYHRRELGSIMTSLNMKAAYSSKSIIQSFDEFRKHWLWYDGRYSIICHHSFTETCEMLSLRRRINAPEYDQFYKENRWQYTLKGIFYFVFGFRHLSKIDFHKLLWLLINPNNC